jgi:hypothetical protein
MKPLNWQVLLGICLLVLSALFYFLHYLIFRDAHHIFIYLIGDIAFVFVEVLLVTLIIHSVLEQREKKARLEKLNMVIGVFYSEVGTKLLEILSKWDPQIESIQKELVIEGKSPVRKFGRICRYLKKHDYSIESKKPDWDTVKAFLMTKKDFLLRLLENQNLLEHETFTDVLWAVFHLAEELEARKSLQGLPDADHRHLSGDVKRVYGQLALQWLKYMEHLKSSYPHLFSLSLRTNPFDRSATPIVQDSP